MLLSCSFGEVGWVNIIDNFPGQKMCYACFDVNRPIQWFLSKLLLWQLQTITEFSSQALKEFPIPLLTCNLARFDLSAFSFVLKFLIDLWEWGPLWHPQRSYTTKCRQTLPTKLQTRKDTKNAFKVWNQNYAIIRSCNSYCLLKNHLRGLFTSKHA